MKIPFSIEYKEQIESGEYKVKTKSGQEVRIVCWDMNTCNGTLIVALVKGYGGEYEKMRSYTLDGKCKGASEEASLFIHTPQPELTEFEKVYSKVKYSSEPYVVFSDEQLAQFKEEASTLLDSARRQIASENSCMTQNFGINSNYDRGYAHGHRDALKDIPKWRFVKLSEDYPACITREVDDNGIWTYQFSIGKLYNCSHYIPLKELEKLNVEEE